MGNFVCQFRLFENLFSLRSRNDVLHVPLLVDPKDCLKQAKNDKRKKCHSERSEESLQLAITLLRCDSSLRSERSYEIKSMCLFRLRNK